MAQTMKRVVKIAGPFNKQDILVDSLVPGESYYYLGTNILPLEEADLLTMKWAYKIDKVFAAVVGVRADGLAAKQSPTT